MKYSFTQSAKDDIFAIGAQAASTSAFIKDAMRGAIVTGKHEGKQVFTSTNRDYLLLIATDGKTVERVVLAGESFDKELPEFHGQYFTLPHAIERFRERFADTAARMTDDNVGTHLNNLLKVATLHSTTPGKFGDCHVYDAYKQNTRIIINKAQGKIVTVHQLKEEAAPFIAPDSPLFAVIFETTKRELGKARRAFRKTNRELTEQLASIQIEMAHAMVNKTRAKGDHIVSAVERKMNELAEQERKVVAMLDAERAKFERVEADAGKVIGGAY